MHPLDGAGLLLGPREQDLEALGIGLAGAQQSAPKRLLGVDPREQSLKFEQPAERRVTAEPPLGFRRPTFSAVQPSAIFARSTG